MKETKGNLFIKNKKKQQREMHFWQLISDDEIWKITCYLGSMARNSFLFPDLDFGIPKPFPEPPEKVWFVAGVERLRGQEIGGAAAIEPLQSTFLMFKELLQGLSSLYSTLSSTNRYFSSHTGPDEPCLLYTLALCKVAMPFDLLIVCWPERL